MLFHQARSQEFSCGGMERWGLGGGGGEWGEAVRADIIADSGFFSYQLSGLLWTFKAIRGVPAHIVHLPSYGPILLLNKYKLFIFICGEFRFSERLSIRNFDITIKM